MDVLRSSANCGVNDPNVAYFYFCSVMSVGSPDEGNGQENTPPVEKVEVLNESFDIADDTNAPVDVFLGEELDDGTCEPTGLYILSTDCYQPRRNSVVQI